MGRLSGFRYGEVRARLRALGFVFDRQGPGSHEVWWNHETGYRTTLPRHPGDIPEGTMRAIVREAGITVDDFLSGS